VPNKSRDVNFFVYDDSILTNKQQYEFGPRSCFNREKEDIAIRIALGLAVQLLCAYVTLPLYTLVTQVNCYRYSLILFKVV